MTGAPGAAVWPVAGASATGFVFTPVLAGVVEPAAAPLSVSAIAPPAAWSARAEALSAPRTACWTAAPGLLEVWAFGSLAGTGVAAAGVAAGTASSLGRRKRK